MSASRSATLLLPVPVPGRHPGELVDVLVDQAQVPCLVERLADHPPSELQRELPDLRAQLLEDTVALGADLVLRPRDDRLRLGLGLLVHLLAHRVGGLARLVDDAVALVARSRELAPIVGQLLFRLLARLLGRLEVTSNLRLPRL